MSKDLEQIRKMSCDEKERIQQEQIAIVIKASGEQAKENVQDLTNMLVIALRENEEQLLNEIDRNISKADRNLRIIRHPTQAQEYIRYFMENDTASEMASSRHQKWYQNFTYDPFEENVSGIEFMPNQENCERLIMKTGLGQVQLSVKPTCSGKSSQTDFKETKLGSGSRKRKCSCTFCNVEGADVSNVQYSAFETEPNSRPEFKM